MESKGEILIYQSREGFTKIDVRLQDETVWLSQAQIGELFQKAKSTVSEHISNVFSEGELEQNSVVRNFRTTAADGKKYDIAFYNLDVIISVGYRVKSHIGTQFRIWATQRLKEYIIKANDYAGHLSKTCPIFENSGTVEVREIAKMDM